jgi:BlaI family transcriptional regulator, penicillinase repressor
VPRIVFTDRELDAMTVLWDLGSATVAEVREALEDELAYTTVLTVLRTLEEKGYVRHEEEGKAHRYFPVVARHDAGKSAVSRLLSTVFRGAPELLLTQLVSDRNISEAELKKLRKLVDENLRGRKR